MAGRWGETSFSGTGSMEVRRLHHERKNCNDMPPSFFLRKKKDREKAPINSHQREKNEKERD